MDVEAAMRKLVPPPLREDVNPKTVVRPVFDLKRKSEFKQAGNPVKVRGTSTLQPLDELLKCPFKKSSPSRRRPKVITCTLTSQRLPAE